MATPDLSKLPPAVLAMLPALTPPPGVIPNFVNPESDGIHSRWTAGLVLSVAGLFLLMRMYTKVFFLRSTDWSDWTCVIAFAGMIVDCSLGVVSISFGLGKHQYDVNLLDIQKFLKLLWLMEMILNPILFLTTLSLLLLYKRLFVIYKRSATWWLIQITLYSNLVVYAGLVFSVMFSCKPVNRFWNVTGPGKCMDLYVVIVFSAAWNVFATFVLVALPIRFIWTLSMSPKKKAGVSAIFLVGILACFSALMRLQLSIRNGGNPDVTHYLLPVMLWTTAEIAMGIICSCAPFMPQFFHHLRHVLPPLMERLPYSRHFSSLTSSIRHPIHHNQSPAANSGEAEKPIARPAPNRKFRHPNDLPTTNDDSVFAPTPRQSRSRFTHFFSTTKSGNQSGNQTGVSEVESVWGLGAAKRGMASMFSTKGTQAQTERSMGDSQATTTIVENEPSQESLPKASPGATEHREADVLPRPSPQSDENTKEKKEWV